MRKKLYGILSVALSLAVLITPLNSYATEETETVLEGTESESTEEGTEAEVKSTETETETEKEVLLNSVEVMSTEGSTELLGDTVSGNDGVVTSWSDYHFESMPAPPEGTQLADELWLSFESIDGISLCFVLPEGSYKFLAYDPKADMVYSDLEVPEPFEEDPSITVYSTILEAHTNPAEFDSVIAAQPAISEAGRYYSCPDLESYILVFKPDATTSKDLLYAFKVGDLVKYLKPDVDDAIRATPGEGSTVSISLVEKLGDAETEEYYGGIFRLDYDIKDENLKGVAIPAEASLLSIDTGDSFMLDFTNKGSREFKLTDMPNGTYNFYVSTEQDLKYTGSFTVDFIKYSEDKTIEISHEDPVVTFSGQPDGKVPIGESVVMHMNTNVSSMMSFDGVVLGNGEYGKSFEFRVTSNGSYNYSISTTGGKCIDAVYVIDFFDETVQLPEDPINSDLVAFDEDSQLTQTGFGYSILLFIVAGLLVVLGSLLILNKKYNWWSKLKGGKGNEE